MSDILKRYGTGYFFSTPAESKVIYIFLAFYLFVLIASIALYIYFRRKDRGPWRSFGKKIFYTKMPVALVGLFLVFSRYEYLRTFSWRFWQYLLLLVYVATDVWLFLELKKVKAEAVKHNSKARKEKWLNKVKSKNSKLKK
jgi:amino acid transporter